MARQLTISLRITVTLLMLVCVGYPVAVYWVGQALFMRQANGSLIRNAQGQIIGSSLLAQGFTKPEYFHPRPSAAGSGYDPTASSGTNLGPTSDKLINGIHKKLANGKDDPSNFDGVKDLAAAYRKENGLGPNDLVPVDAVTRSASGLDPEISVQNATIQAPRVARARGIPLDEVWKLARDCTHQATLGFLGPPRVNVMELNVALDKEYPVQATKR